MANKIPIHSETILQKIMTASEMGKLGAQARIRATTSEERKAWARKAGKASGKARRKKTLTKIEPNVTPSVQPISTTL